MKMNRHAQIVLKWLDREQRYSADAARLVLIRLQFGLVLPETAVIEIVSSDRGVAVSSQEW